jgi:K+-sensing histidine kinase KdpD
VSTSPSARQIGVGAEVALAAVAGAVSFLLVAVVLSVADSDVAAVIVAVVVGAAVLEIAHRWGAVYAIPAAVLALVAFDWFVFPPTHPEAFPDRNNLLSLLAYLAIGTVAGELAAYGARRAASSEAARALLADEQAALRRVATEVARGALRQEVFEAIAREVGHLVGVEEILMLRYEDERHATVLATAMPRAEFAPGSRQLLGGENLATRVRETGRSARIDDFGQGQRIDRGHGARSRLALGRRDADRRGRAAVGRARDGDPRGAAAAA